ncbi:MAG TPA: TonB-dependent receptor, partial [Nevskiaceae bacterium]|nr:TonB-dependent receptor [Nevskiaceae bacterium]
NGLTFDSTGAEANGGKQRFQGAEIEARYALAGALALAGNASYHDARFRRFTQDDGSMLDGNRLETAPYTLAGLGLVYAPPRGFNASVTGNYTGPRQLNNPNTLPAGGYTTLDAGLGWRFGQIALSVNGYNLTDRRDPVSASELSEVATNHDGVNTIGYYRLPARSVMAGISLDL